MLMMAVVMYEDYGIRYNPERIGLPANMEAHDRFFADSRDIFLHGRRCPSRSAPTAFALFACGGREFIILYASR